MPNNTHELPTPTQTQIATLLAERYQVHPVALAPIGHDAAAGRAVFRCDFADGSAWLLYAFARQAVTPVWFGGGPAGNWLHSRASLLAWLERQGYPAPRVIPTSAGRLIAENDDAYLMALSYIPGAPSDMSRDEPRQIGALLGRLHTLPVTLDLSVALPSEAAVEPIPNSWWFPLGPAVTPFVDALEAVAATTPERWRALHGAFADTLRSVANADLPATLIHGDCHPGNAIVTPSGSVALIDWECAGLGAAVLDLGVLLTDCSPDLAPGEPVTVDPAQVEAVVEGYRTYRALTLEERDILPAACRFGVAFLGAIRFRWALEQGWSQRIEQSLARLQSRYEIAGRVAALAQASL